MSFVFPSSLKHSVESLLCQFPGTKVKIAVSKKVPQLSSRRPNENKTLGRVPFEHSGLFSCVDKAALPPSVHTVPHVCSVVSTNRSSLNAKKLKMEKDNVAKRRSHVSDNALLQDDVLPCQFAYTMRTLQSPDSYVVSFMEGYAHHTCSVENKNAQRVPLTKFEVNFLWKRSSDTNLCRQFGRR